MTRSPEDGTGLVELLVAAALGLLGLAVVAAVARGPITAATAAAAPQPRIEGLLLLREVVGGQVRAARGAGTVPQVLAAGPDHVVLGTGLDDGAGWTRLSILEGTLRVDEGAGAPPHGPAATGRRLMDLPDAAFVVEDVAGRGIVGPAGPALTPGDRRLGAAAALALNVEVDVRTHEIAVALRPGP